MYNYIFLLIGAINLLFFGLEKNRNYNSQLMTIARILVLINSTLNPIIYAFRLKAFRDEVRKLLCLKSSKVEMTNSVKISIENCN